MSFLESIQHGLEKATQEATRITKIQHFHNVVNDLHFRVTQEEQALIVKALELYQNGSLNQGELVAICQQMATYQQQLNEVHEEIQRLQNSQEDGVHAGIPIPPPPTAYPAYPTTLPVQVYAPGTAAPVYPPYAAPPAGYPAYATPAVYPPAYAQPAYSASPGGEPPTGPGAPTANIQQSLPSSEVPTRPGVRKPEVQPEVVSTLSSEVPTRPGVRKPEVQPEVVSTEAPARTEPEPEAKPHHHKASEASAKPAAKAVQDTEMPADSEPGLTKAPGSYQDGVLPPIFSPFVNNPAPQANAVEAEPEKPARTHHKKDTTSEPAESDSTEAPAKEKKAHKATETQA